jgi:hypothetical protein
MYLLLICNSSDRQLDQHASVPNSRTLQTRDSASFRHHDNDYASINTSINIEQGLYSLGLIAMFSMLIGRFCGTAFEIVFGLQESLLNVNTGPVVLVRWVVVGFMVYIAWWYAVQSQDQGRSLAVGWIMSVSLLSSPFFSWHRSLPFRPIGAAFQLDIDNCTNSAHRDRTWVIRSL